MSVNYHKYIKSAAWRKRARGAKKHAKGRCQVCYSDGELHAHHRTYERLGNEEPMDLTVLCSDCHKLVHGRLATLESEQEWKQWADTFRALGIATEGRSRDPYGDYQRVGITLRIISSEDMAEKGLRVLARHLGI